MTYQVKTLAVVFLWCGLILSSTYLFAQKSNNIVVKGLNNENLHLAWAGGLSAPQFSEIDLNDDSIMDLFVFDREGDRILTFINNGTAGQVDYTYAPEYESSFPQLRYWALLKDYNNDGKNDLFTYHDGGIKVYKNKSTAGNISFKLEVFPNLTSYFAPGYPAGNIYVSPQDIPAIVDVDSDGDLDVLSFGINSDQVSFYENFAQDSGSLETFRFHDNTYCWGNFKEDALTNGIILNVSCPKVKLKAKGNKHGGASILGFDPDNNQTIDLLLGDPSFTNLVFLENGGNKAYANMVSFDDSFPSYNQSIDLYLFPAAYYLDVDNDGLKDLLVAPNSTNSVENFKGIWFYKNVGTSTNAIFSFQQDNFLQESMIELGSNAYPAFYDYNFDGLEDLIVGNGGYFLGPGLVSHNLALFENIGTATKPKFKLIDTDYADLSQYNLNTNVNRPTFHPVPAFGDLNNDGVKDLLIGDFQGKLHLFENQPKAGKSNFVFSEVNYQSIDVGSYANPYIIDLDEDGLFDIVSGKENGKINYYHNKGSIFKAVYDSFPDDNTLGNINMKAWNDYDGYSQSSFYKSNNDLYFIGGSKQGSIFRYSNIRGNIGGNFTLLDSMYLNFKAGNRAHVAMADINNDGKFELIVGNSAGGLNLIYTDDFVGIKKVVEKNKNFKIIWPSDQSIEIISSYSGLIQGSLYTVTGVKVIDFQFYNKKSIDLSSYKNGLYLVSLYFGNSRETQKIILAR